MHVRWLELTAFRIYASLGLAPDPGLNVLIGPNGQGKTSLLEALHLLLASRSFRTGRPGECVAWGAERATVRGELVFGVQARTIQLTVVARGGIAAPGEPSAWAHVVAYAATDLALLTGPPQGRRAYLDGVTAKLVPAHAETCRRYRLILQQRGGLLVSLAGRPDADRLLEPWDEQVATLGSEIVHRRLAALAALGPDVQAVWSALARPGSGLQLVYAPVVAPGEDVAATRERLLTALAAGRHAEFTRGATLVGPHRDELLIRLGSGEARSYASRGEQRLVVLTLRLAEAASVRRRLGRPPVLLLDDLLSELDRMTCERVLAWLRTQGQVLFSATDTLPEVGRGGTVWHVHSSAVAPVGIPRGMAAAVAGGAA